MLLHGTLFSSSISASQKTMRMGKLVEKNNLWLWLETEQIQFCRFVCLAWKQWSCFTVLMEAVNNFCTSYSSWWLFFSFLQVLGIWMMLLSWALTLGLEHQQLGWRIVCVQQDTWGSSVNSVPRATEGRLQISDPIVLVCHVSAMGIVKPATLNLVKRIMGDTVGVRLCLLLDVLDVIII